MRGDSWWRRGHWGFLFIVLAALAARTIYLLEYRRSVFYEVFRNDQLFYRTWGLQIASGDLLGDRVFSQGPLYAYFLAAAFRCLGPGETRILVLQILAGLVTVALVFWSASRLWGSRSAGLAGFIAAIYGPFVFYECMIMKTFLEPLLVIAALAAGLQGLRDGRVRSFAAAGGLVGLACLVRESHLLLLAPLLLAAWRAKSLKEPARRLCALRAGAVLGVWALAIAPATLHNWSVGREFIPVTTGGGQNLYIGFWPGATGYYTTAPFDSRVSFQEHEDFHLEASLRSGRRLSPGEASRYWLDEAWHAILDSPRRALGLVAVKAVGFFNDYERPDNEDYNVARAEIPFLRFLPTFGWIVGLGALGLFAALRGGGDSWLPAGFAAFLTLEVLLTFNLGRYRAGFAAIWILCAGHGLAWLGALVFHGKSTGLGRRIALPALAVLLSGSAFLTPPRTTRHFIAWEDEKFRSQAKERAVVRDMIAPIQRTLATWPEYPELYAELALALDSTGKVNESLPVFEKALLSDPGAAAIRFRYAEILGEMGDLEQAVGHARILARQTPGDPPAHVLLSKLLILQALRAADDATSHQLLEEAVGHLGEALTLDPRNVQALEWSERLSRSSRHN